MRTVSTFLGMLTIAGLGQLPAAWSQNNSPVVFPPPLPTPPQQSLPAPLPQQEWPQPGIPQPGIALPGAGGASPPPSSLPHSGNLPNAPRNNPYAHLPAVTIREFRSNVQEVPARGATDMFITALIKTRSFRVVERARMSEGIAQEKALNQQGMTTGDLGQSRYVGAGYIFEATVSEYASATERTSFGINIAGLDANATSTKDVIGIDVRVIDVESGVILDAIDVRRDLLGEEKSVGGVTTALANLLTQGRGSRLADNLAPNDIATIARKDSVDSALRAAIEEAVGTIARRFGADTDTPSSQQPATATPRHPARR